MGDKKRKLTDKQKLFCELYAKYLNKTHAAKEAYPNMKGTSAKSLGYKLMTDIHFSHVQEYANQCIKSRLDDLGVNKDSIIAEISKIAYCELPAVRVGPGGITPAEDIETLSQELEFKQTKMGNNYKWKAPDKLRALGQLYDIVMDSEDDGNGDEMTIIHIGKPPK